MPVDNENRRRGAKDKKHLMNYNYMQQVEYYCFW